MGTTLTYGRFRPANGDPSSTWMPGLAANVTLDDSHDHDGVNSPALSPTSFEKFSSSISAGDLVAGTDGNFSLTVTVPSGISSAAAPFNDIQYYNPVCKFSSGGASGYLFYPDIERASATTFVIRLNTNAYDIVIYYS